MPYKIEGVGGLNNELTTENSSTGKNIKKILTAPYKSESNQKKTNEDIYKIFKNERKIEEMKSSEYQEPDQAQDENENDENEQTNIFYIIKIKDVYYKSKKLKLEIVSGHSLKDKIFPVELNPLGYPESRRSVKDGVTYFGCEREGGIGGISEGIDQSPPPLDIILKPPEDIMDEKFYGKHFYIKFNPDDLNYYIKDLGHGFGTFIKINDWTQIKNNFLVNIGENYLIFSFDNQDNNSNFNTNNNENNNFIENNNINLNDNININKKNLNIKIFSGKIKEKIISFTPENSPFTIGRSSETQIFIEDNMLSRVHCTVEYRNGKWMVIDGNVKKNIKNNEEEVKKSTNGSWIYAYEDIPITDQMIFKSDGNLFLCSLIDPN